MLFQHHTYARSAISSLNVLAKYADDTYLIIPDSNYNTCQAEIQNIEQWANVNNLKLNRT